MPQQIDVPGMGIVEFPDGMNDDQIAAAIKANMPAQSSQAGDIAKSAGIGLAKGAIGTAGAGGDIGSILSSGVQSGADWIASKLGLEKQSGLGSAAVKNLPVVGSVLSGPTSQQIQGAVEGETGDFYKPQTTLGKYAQTVGEFAPAAVMPARSLVGRVANVVAPGVASEAAGQATEGKAVEPWARLVGALAGSAGPAALRRAVTPIPMSPERQKLVDALTKEGVTSITAGQKTGNNALRYQESALGDAPFAGGKAKKMADAGLEEFTQAATRRAGITGAATPEELAANQKRLGQIYDDVAARNIVKPDQQFVNDMLGTAQKYVDTVLPSQRAAGKQNIETIIRDIVGEMQKNGGHLTGEMYKATRSRLSSMGESVRTSDPQLHQAIRGIRKALEGAFERSAVGDDAAFLRQTNKEYGAQKILEKAASRAGEATGEGKIVPANLRNTVSAENRGAYARGESDLGNLARAGATVMQPMPQSGTAPRSLIYNLANWASAGAAPAVAGRVLMSRPVQAYLGNQVLPGGDRAATRKALIAALLSGQAPALLGIDGKTALPR